MDEPARTIGKYKILGVLGRGSMGIVYKAQDPEIGRIVAIKTLRKILTTSHLSIDSALERFRLEAKSAGNLRHPNIITVFEVGKDSQTPYIVMDFVDGESLDAVLARERKLPPALALRYLEQLSSALDYAHDRGVTHRDLKPGNLIVDKFGGIFIVDFGVASIQDSLEQGPDTGSRPVVVGSPGYMSPEQIRNEKLDRSSDLFSLGVVLFESLTGQRPFPGETGTQVVGNILRLDPIPPSAANPELSRLVDKIFERVLAKKRGDRYPSARAFYDALSNAITRDDSPKSASSASTSPASWSDESGIRERTLVKVKHISKESVSAPSAYTRPVYSNLPVKREPRAAAKQSRRYSKDSRGVFGSDLSLGAGDGVFVKHRLSFFRRLTILTVIISLVAGTSLLLLVSRSKIPSPGVNGKAGVPSTTIPISLLALPVAELNNDELISVLGSGATPEAKTLEILQESVRRKAPGLEVACAQLLKNRSYVVRIEGLKTLAELKDKKTLGAIYGSLNDADPLVRVQAVKSASTVGGRKALGHLTQRLGQEQTQEVRTAINNAISELSEFPAD
jgi:serine/threonine protein kinase